MNSRNKNCALLPERLPRCKGEKEISDEIAFSLSLKSATQTYKEGEKKEKINKEAAIKLFWRAAQIFKSLDFYRMSAQSIFRLLELYDQEPALFKQKHFQHLKQESYYLLANLFKNYDLEAFQNYYLLTLTRYFSYEKISQLKEEVMDQDLLVSACSALWDSLIKRAKSPIESLLSSTLPFLLELSEHLDSCLPPNEPLKIDSSKTAAVINYLILAYTSERYTLSKNLPTEIQASLRLANAYTRLDAEWKAVAVLQRCVERFILFLNSQRDLSDSWFEENSSDVSALLELLLKCFSMSLEMDDRKRCLQLEKLAGSLSEALQISTPFNCTKSAVSRQLLHLNDYSTVSQFLWDDVCQLSAVISESTSVKDRLKCTVFSSLGKSFLYCSW
ncbi:uncharacterized protein LOC135146309 [Zophobas morio]|uniref:uncharacterized protein LOC135146309 n=1 Tax=Zophobas morio TaxID=2755281 RepID=UPI003082B795